MLDAIPYACAPDVHPALVRQLVRVESGGNPYAIGVVGGRLARQPRNLAEALATVQSLEQQGANYSIGISQVNRIHFPRLGWHKEPASGFDPCGNLQAGAGILKTCYERALGAGYAGTALDGANAASRASLSCYYSGNFVSGERLGYVAKVLGSAQDGGRQPGRLTASATSSILFD
ncbi:lytic transglycosylase domain-containing protein [Massilia sp. BJB1822]|uniref:lytic transglycosylase domain-containing protein n=1 Tax=Massilia sp. BJB1822 TaxID=2744470 RepID=UPI001592EBE9|nr:lytic transglycosylase domain-containing protein [Massilia sp. BJB1822]NVE00154.1 lytic transglycosylase domain-containing protein [Massilia sp. BJB1822]